MNMDLKEIALFDEGIKNHIHFNLDRTKFSIIAYVTEIVVIKIPDSQHPEDMFILEMNIEGLYFFERLMTAQNRFAKTVIYNNTNNTTSIYLDNQVVP